MSTAMTPSEPKYPAVEVQLTGEDGDAFVIISRIAHAMRRGRVSEIEIARFLVEAKSGDYDNVLTTAGRWVTVS